MDNQICQFCGREFIWGRKRKYCSDDCCYDAQLDKQKDLRQAKQQIKKCIYCGREFISRSKDHVCCGDDGCKKARKRKAYKPKSHEERRLKSVTCICVGCGIEFRPVSKQYDKYHSRECFFEHLKANARGRTPRPKKPKKPNKPKNIVTCEVCKKDFETNQPKAKYCSDECRRIAGVDRAYKKNTAISRNCKWCGTEFIPDHRASTYAYCCEEHKQLAIKEHEEKYGISKAKRKRIYLRDGCNCKLCGKPMRMDMVHTLGTSNPHPLAPTIDHIIPKSIAKQQGWTKKQIHDDSNLQAAHWRCNIDKGVKPMGEQLLLFG